MHRVNWMRSNTRSYASGCIQGRDVRGLTNCPGEPTEPRISVRGAFANFGNLINLFLRSESFRSRASVSILASPPCKTNASAPAQEPFH